MRVLFLSHIFPRPGKPNLGIFSLQQLAAMADAGHAVRAVSPRPWTEGLRPKRWDAAGGPPGLSKMRVDYPLYGYPPGILRNTYGWFMWASCRRAVRRAVADFRPDCVLSYWAHPDGYAAVAAARAAGIPSAVIVGGSDVLVLPRESRSRRRSILSVLRSVDAVVTVSRHLADASVSLGVPEERVHVVYQGVDRSRFASGDQSAARARLGIPLDGPVALFVGSLIPVKGVDVLLDALARLRATGIDVTTYLVGDGPSRSALESQSAALGLRQAVRFAGPVPQHLLPDWYRAADLMVLASRSEGIPNVLREAMATGLSFVASRVGGIHEIAGPHDRLVPPEDPAAMAEAIADSIRTAARGRLPGRGQTWAESASKLIEVMEPLVAANRRWPRPDGACETGGPLETTA